MPSPFRLPDSALLIGQGRSGTNFLLSLLDLSARTHCRNEPDQLDRSALSRLVDFRFFVDDSERLRSLFDEAITEAAGCIGPRDHMAAVEKDWIRAGRRRPGYFWLRQRTRLVERVLRRRAPMDGCEVRFPGWMVDAQRLAESLHVFKLNAAIGVGSWVLEQRPEVRVFQIVRHPGGFLKSWEKRWVRGEGGMGRGQGTADVLVDEDRLREVARRDKYWADLLGDVDAMERAEGELWWWRYVNERLYEAGRDRPNYHLALYERLASDPVQVTRDAYAFSGLEWTPDIEARVRSIARGAERIARAWKDELPPDRVALVEKVLDGSPMAAWWSDEELERHVA
jgi:hypothetical protein